MRKHPFRSATVRSVPPLAKPVAIVLAALLLALAFGHLTGFDAKNQAPTTPTATAIFRPDLQFESHHDPGPTALASPTQSKQTEPTLDPAVFDALEVTLDGFRNLQEATQNITVPASLPAPSPINQADLIQGARTQSFTYVLDGKAGTLSVTTYAGLTDHLASLPRTLSYYPGISPKPTTRDFLMRNLDEPNQAVQLKELANKIRQATSDPSEQARIAISLVQQIPYDSIGVASDTITGKYPYEVLYTATGVCQEKSELLVFLLRELGFGTAIFRYDAQNHETVGIACDEAIDYLDSGYCFIETTGAAIPTYSNGTYAFDKLTTVPEIVPASDGRRLDLSEEYADAQAYDHLVQIGPVLSQSDYAQWQQLRQEYGLELANYSNP